MTTTLFLKTFMTLMILASLSACAQSTINPSPAKPARPENAQCELSQSEREAILRLDYKAFDQTLPDGGWRKYEPCSVLARELIDTYTARHEKTLQKQEWDVLVWHSGQMSALAGDAADAISKMQKTLKPNEKPTDAFLWNPYANASIAFLKRDRAALLSERQKLAAGLSPFNRINLRKVDGFIRCFDASYELAYGGNCEPAETEVLRIRSLAVPVELSKPLPQEFFGLTDFLTMRKVILVGEVHGTNEVPQLFANIVASVAKKQKKVGVFLEISQDAQSAIDAFLKTSDESILRKNSFFQRELQDGRSSKAMVQLLRGLAKLSNVTVFCMDPLEEKSSIMAQQRDTGMAAFINAHQADFDTVLALTGNVHSSTALGTPWDLAFRPMGYELKAMAKELPEGSILNILVRYGKSEAWNCRESHRRSCKAYRSIDRDSPYVHAVSFANYFVWELPDKDGHSASVFLRSTTASSPLVNGVSGNHE